MPVLPATGPGYTTEDLIEVAGRLSGSPFDDFFAQYIRSTMPYPLEQRVGILGLKLVIEPEGMQAYSGIHAKDQGAQTFVRYVLSDGPAYISGILAGDEIVALNGKRYTATEMSTHVERIMKPGDAIRLEVLRRGRQRTVEFILGAIPRGQWQLSRMESPASAQRSAYTSWLHQPWPD